MTREGRRLLHRWRSAGAGGCTPEEFEALAAEVPPEDRAEWYAAVNTVCEGRIREFEAHLATMKVQLAQLERRTRTRDQVVDTFLLSGHVESLGRRLEEFRAVLTHIKREEDR